jgi:cell division protein ZapA
LSKVNVKINGRDYKVSCDDGEEERLVQLGRTLDDRVKKIIAVAGQIGEARLLVMVSLMLADELSDVYSELEENLTLDVVLKADETVSANIDEVARRIENIAERIEQA